MDDTVYTLTVSKDQFEKKGELIKHLFNQSKVDANGKVVEGFVCYSTKNLEEAANVGLKLNKAKIPSVKNWIN